MTTGAPSSPTFAQLPFRANPTLAVGLTAVLALILPVAIVRNEWGAFSSQLLLQMLVAAVAGAMLAYTVALRTPAFLQLVVYLFAYIWMGLAPLVQIATNRSPIPLVLPPSVQFSASLLVLAGLIAYMLGSHVPPLKSRRTGAMARLYRRELVPARVAILVAVAVVLFIYAVPKLGGIGTFFHTRQEAIAARQGAQAAGDAGTGSTLVLLSWALSVTAFWSLLSLLILGRMRGARNPVWWTIVIPLMAMNVVVNNPISRPRYWAGTVLLGLLLSSPLLRGIRGYRFAAFSLLAVIFLAFPYADYFRYKATDRGDRGVVSVSDQFVTNNYDAYAMAGAGLQYADVHGHSPRFLFTDIFFYVPRYLWPGKSEDVGVVLSEENNFTLTNRSSPLWIESYLWGGVGSTLVVFALLGVAHRRLDDAHADEPNPDFPEVGTAFVPVIAVFGLFYLRGSLLVAMPPLTLLIAVPLLISRRVRTDSDIGAVDDLDEPDDRDGDVDGPENSPSTVVRTKEIAP